MYSYKTPRSKPLFDPMTKMWILFLSAIFLGLLSYGIFLYIRSDNFNSEIEEIKKRNEKLSKSVNSMEKELKYLKSKKVLAQKILKSNILVENSIKNLFNLVPDQITLSKVIMEKDMLRLEGLSFTKDAYRLLLEPPLKSIFESSNVKFKYDPQIGSYKFISINKTQLTKQEDSKNVKR